MTKAKQILEAASQGETERVLTLLDRNPNLLDSAGPDGVTPLGCAAQAGHLGSVLALLEHGADPSIGDPIKAASCRNHAPIVRALVAAGVEPSFVQACKAGILDAVRSNLEADPSLVHAKDDGFPIIDWACEAGHVDVGRALVDRGAKADIFTCASLGLRERIEAHVTEAPDLLEAARPLFDYRPLHCAAECGQPEIVQFLLERGANANAPNEWGATPVFFAVIAARHYPATAAHSDCVKLLLEGGGRPIANVEPDTKLSGSARNAINYAPNGESATMAREILDYVEVKESEPGEPGS